MQKLYILRWKIFKQGGEKMKKSKKLLSLLLAVLLLCSLLPAAASAEGNPEDDYPFVFVHGLMGWGERSMLDPIMPYWGMTTGNLMKYLNSKGYESYAAQVGPLSGAGTERASFMRSLSAERLTTALRTRRPRVTIATA